MSELITGICGLPPDGYIRLASLFLWPLVIAAALAFAEFRDAS